MGAFEIYRARRGEYRFRYRASTGEIVATSAAYPTRREAKAAMAAVFRPEAVSARAQHPLGEPRRSSWRGRFGSITIRRPH